MNNILTDASLGFAFVRERVEKQEGLIGLPIFLNGYRHMVLKTKKENIYYCLFKREYFNSFNAFFQEYLDVHPEHKGIAESINKEFLAIALSYHATLLFVHQDGRIYTIPAETVRELGLVREQKSGVEKTYHVPIRMLERYNP